MLKRTADESQRGATLIEAAIVMPLVFLITLAVLEFGLAFATISTTTSASRDGARYATTFFATKPDKLAVSHEIREVVERDLGSLTSATPRWLWIYKATPSGEPIGGRECTTDCFRFEWNSSAGGFVYRSDLSNPWSLVNACFSMANTIDEVGVMVEVDHHLLTTAIGRGVRTIRERTVLRLEPLPTYQCTG